MNEIIFVFCDDWQAIYVNGELKNRIISTKDKKELVIK